MGNRKPHMKTTTRLPKNPGFRAQAFCLAALLTVAHGSAAEPDVVPKSDDDSDFMAMSLENLMAVRVDIVTRTPQRVGDVPAAVSVITAEDIRRSGATSIPEALRLAPGVEAARINANAWAVTIRGFNSYLANKLLVLMDGRSVYTPLFGGTYWDVQNPLLDDIDRIEIIRGPGATVWGANAVNGVVNIITKSAKDTQGFLVKAGGGTEVHGLIAGRYGGKLADDLFFRLYAKYKETDDSVLPGGFGADDGWHVTRGGFRLDWEPQETTRATLQGDLYAGREHNTFTLTPTGGFPPVATVPDYGRLRGGNLLARFTRDLTSETKLTLQAYYDRTERETQLVDEARDTGDVELRVTGAAGERHEWVAGAGYRVSGDDINTRNASVAFFPSRRTTHQLSAFLQDEVQLVPEKLSLTLGSKFEYFSYTSFEYQPGARLQYLPAPGHSLWMSVSRAVRTPSRSENDIIITPPGPASIFGSTATGSEELIAYEAGYKARASERLDVELALFFNDYQTLRSTEVVSPFASAFGNLGEGEVWGVELTPRYQVSDWWRLSATYSHLTMELRSQPGSADTLTPLQERNSPRHTVNLRSQMDLPYNVQLDMLARFVDNILITSPAGAQGIPSYWALDVRLGWKPRPDLELAVIGKNLLDPSHPEFSETIIPLQSTEVQRSVLATLTWEF